jgi:glutathione peroxidase
LTAVHPKRIIVSESTTKPIEFKMLFREARMTTVYDFSANTIDGTEQSLAVYRGKPLLIVNVASKCGFTSQYTGLEALYRKYASQGFVVLGFPCDQFGHQEPGDEAEIKNFCSLQYDVTFPLFAKIDVNGDQTHPLYRHLKHSAKGLFGTEAIKWNFTKFLVDRNGKIVRRYAPSDKPESIEADLAEVL